MMTFFDLLIILFLVVDLALIATLVHQEFHLICQKQSCLARKIVVGICLLIALTAGVLVFYGSFIEPRLVVTRHESLELRAEGTKHLRVALLADFHAGTNFSEVFLKKVVERTRAENPDVVLLAGDYVSFGDNRALPMLRSLGEFGASLGTFAVLGNHDYLGDAEEVKSKLESFGITVLDNESVVVGQDSPLAISGVSDLWFGKMDLAAATKDLVRGLPRLLLAHNPDVVFALDNYKFDAILTGHTHGGQISLPWIGPIIPVPTVLGRKFDHGVFDWQGTPLVITEGIGVTGPRARLFTPPEIMILDVTF